MAPRNEKGVRSLLGAIGYYRDFIPLFSHYAKPLTKLLKKDAMFIWDEECNDALEQLKKQVDKEVELAHPYPDRKFYLDTDASDVAMAAVLYQYEEIVDCKGNTKSVPRPIQFISRTFTKAETSYSIMEKEVFAATWAITKFNCLLYIWTAFRANKLTLLPRGYL